MEEVTENTSSTFKTPVKKKKRPRFIRIVPCQVILHFQFKLACYSLYLCTQKQVPLFSRNFSQVCGDDANDHEHYGGIACYACKAFFRRAVAVNMKFECKIFNRCHIDKKSRNHCKSCRLAKCFRIGMQSQWVMTEYDKRNNVVGRHENNQNQEIFPRMLTDYQWRMRFATLITIFKFFSG